MITSPRTCILKDGDSRNKRLSRQAKLDTNLQDLQVSSNDYRITKKQSRVPEIRKYRRLVSLFTGGQTGQTLRKFRSTAKANSRLMLIILMRKDERRNHLTKVLSTKLSIEDYESIKTIARALRTITAKANRHLQFIKEIESFFKLVLTYNSMSSPSTPEEAEEYYLPRQQQIRQQMLKLREGPTLKCVQSSKMDDLKLKPGDYMLLEAQLY